MKEVKDKKEEFKERDEIESYFSDAKKKSFPIWIIFLLLLLGIIGGCIYYYFVIDNPKNIFLTITDNILSSIKANTTDYEQISLDYSLDANITTNNKEYLDIVNILNQISLEGKQQIDYNQKKLYGSFKTFYQGKDLLSLELLCEDDNAYLKSTELFDKVIKLKFTEEEQKDMDTSFEDKRGDIDTFSETLIPHVKELLNNAEYSKEYTELEETLVKKITVSISKDLMEKFYDDLLNDQEFIENYAHLADMTEEEVEESLNESKKDLTEDYEKISLYLSIFENEFIMLEDIYGEDRLIITKEEEEYLYKIYSNSIIEYQGSVSINKNNNDYQISFSLEDIEEEINLELDIDLSIEYNQSLKTLDTSNSIDSEELTEEDINQIITNITNNQNLNTLYEDIIMIYQDETTTDNSLQTT